MTATPVATAPVQQPSAPARRLSDHTRWDRWTRPLLAVAALVPGFALAFLAYQMFKEAYPAIRFAGTGFFTSKTFSFGNLNSPALEVRNGYKAAHGATYGILPLIFGTVVSSLIALVLAVPISLGGAVLLVEKIPRRLQGALGVFLELLAGIPSVVYGLWGVYTFGPFMARNIFKPISHLGIPWLSKPVPPGEGLLSASLVLTVMIIPIIAATTRELIRTVPPLTKEGAVALGLTSSESVRLVTIPFIRTGVAAAALLGWARALGETIAVLLISGNLLNGYPHSVFDAFSTMAATIASLLDGAFNDFTGMGVHALAYLGLVLLFITIITNFAGRWVARHLGGGTGLPVGRGV